MGQTRVWCVKETQTRPAKKRRKNKATEISHRNQKYRRKNKYLTLVPLMANTDNQLEFDRIYGKWVFKYYIGCHNLMMFLAKCGLKCNLSS